jgi:hypothetical protein
VVSLIRKQLSGAVAVEHDGSNAILEQDGAISRASTKASSADQLGGALRILGTARYGRGGDRWKTLAVVELSPDLKFLSEADAAVPVDSPDAIEVAPHDGVSSISRWRRSCSEE